MKKAVIVGCDGQDGRIAVDLLNSRNYQLIGIDRNTIKPRDAWASPIDICNFEDVSNLLTAFTPDEVYYFAAFHHSSEDAVTASEIKLFHESYRINVLGLLHFLEGIRITSPKTRLFYAGSSLLFGETDTVVQNETTPFSPNTAYGISKLDGLMSCRYYQGKHRIFASTGIFYNHESHYRSENFLSRKIVKGAMDIKLGKRNKLVLGDINAEVDWGYAPDYVDAAYRILNANAPGEFIIATGEKHSIRDFAEIAFAYLGMNWRDYVEENKEIITRKRKTLVGCPDKLKITTGWRPTVSFREMIRLLLRAEGAEV